MVNNDFIVQNGLKKNILATVDGPHEQKIHILTTLAMFLNYIFTKLFLNNKNITFNNKKQSNRHI